MPLVDRESVQLRCEELEGQWAGAASSSSVSLRTTGSGEFGAGEKDNLTEVLGRSFWLLCGEPSTGGKGAVVPAWLASWVASRSPVSTHTSTHGASSP